MHWTLESDSEKANERHQEQDRSSGFGGYLQSFPNKKSQLSALSPFAAPSRLNSNSYRASEIQRIAGAMWAAKEYERRWLHPQRLSHQGLVHNASAQFPQTSSPAIATITPSTLPISTSSTTHSMTAMTTSSSSTTPIPMSSTDHLFPAESSTETIAARAVDRAGVTNSLASKRHSALTPAMSLRSTQRSDIAWPDIPKHIHRFCKHGHRSPTLSHNG